MANTIGYSIELNTQKAEKQLEQLGKKGEQVTSGAKGAEKSVHGIGTGVANITKALKSVAKVLAVIKAVTAPVKVALEVSKLADTIDKTSQTLQMSAQQYQKWNFVAQRSGVEMSTLGRIVRSYNNNISKTGKTFEEAVAEVQGISDATAKAQRAQELFGSQYAKMMPLLNMSNGQMSDLINTYEMLGIAMSDDAVMAGVALQDAITNLKGAFQGLKNQMAVALLPVIKEIVEWLTAIVAVLGKIVAKVREVFGGASSSASEAVSATTTIAGNMGSAAGSAKAMQKALMGFDKLNVLNSPSGGGGGGSGASASSGDVMPGATTSDYNSLADKIGKVSEKLKEAWEWCKGLWEELDDKYHITATLKTMFEGIADVWANSLYPALKNLIKSLTDLWNNPTVQAIINHLLTDGLQWLGERLQFAMEQFSLMANSLQYLFSAIDKALKGDFKGAYEDIGKMGRALGELNYNAFHTFVDDVKDLVGGALGKLGDGISGIGDKFKMVFTEKLPKGLDNLFGWIPKIGKKATDEASNSAGAYVNSVNKKLSAPVRSTIQFATLVGGVSYADEESAGRNFANLIKGSIEKYAPKVNIGTTISDEAKRSIEQKLQSQTYTVDSKVSIKVPDMKYAGNQGAKQYADGWNTANIRKKGDSYVYDSYTPPSDLQHLISAHATGGIIQKPILAGSHLMGEAGKEAILPLDHPNSEGWMEELAQKLGGTGSNVVLKVDGRQLGYACINAINGITRNTGRCQLAL